MPTILLVEDDVAVRRVLWHMLANLGHDVLEAGSAPQALELAASYSGVIDILITDVVMPQTNCDRFVEQLSETRDGMKVIFISGYSEDMLSRYGVEQSRPNFIQKPFSAEQLAAKIREVLGGTRSRGANSQEQ
jgi:two-component system, cell cycle sensor histidine kinase and response regulator CckA